MNKIRFYDFEVKSSLQQRKKIRDFLSSLFYNEQKVIEKVDIVFCTDDYLLKLNKTFLQHHYLTDTLSFILSNKNEAIIGEIYISVPRIRINSQHYDTTYHNELFRVIIHSCLHLCGYKDKPRSERLIMENKQEKYLRDYCST